MDIGTGKDLADYTVGDKQIPYHLIDICEPGTKYNLFQYQQDFYDAYQDVLRRGRLPILCGGTGLYIESVLKGYHLSPVPQNPVLRERLADKSLAELTEMLQQLKARNGSHMHNRTDIDDASLARAESIYTVEHAKEMGVELHYVNTAKPGCDTNYLRELSGGTGYDDVICFAPVKPVVEQASDILGFDGCLNFFAGPTNSQFKAEFNWYNVHYLYTHVVGTSGDNDQAGAYSVVSQKHLCTAAEFHQRN